MLCVLLQRVKLAVRLHSSPSAGLRSGFSTPGTHTKAVPSGRDGAAVMLYRRSYVVSSSAFISPVREATVHQRRPKKEVVLVGSVLLHETAGNLPPPLPPPHSVSVAPSTLSRKRCRISRRHASACNQLRNTRVSLGPARGCNSQPS